MPSTPDDLLLGSSWDHLPSIYAEIYLFKRELPDGWTVSTPRHFRLSPAPPPPQQYKTRIISASTRTWDQQPAYGRQSRDMETMKISTVFMGIVSVLEDAAAKLRVLTSST